MARIRSVKPGYFSSLDIADLTIPTRLHFIGLWTYADDEGRGVDDPRLIKAAIWPLDTEVTAETVDSMQAELEAKGRIIRYQVDGRPHFQIVNWHDHQKPNRPQTSKYPGPDQSDTNAHAPTGPSDVNDHEPFTADAVRHHTVSDEDGSQEGRGGEGRGEDSCASGAREALASAVVAACRMDSPAAGTSPHSRLMAAVADLALQGARPHDVPTRAHAYRSAFPTATLTPHALAKHWPQLVPTRDPAASHDPGRNDRAAALAAAGLTDDQAATA